MTSIFGIRNYRAFRVLPLVLVSVASWGQNISVIASPGMSDKPAQVFWAELQRGELKGGVLVPTKDCSQMIAVAKDLIDRGSSVVLLHKEKTCGGGWNRELRPKIELGELARMKNSSGSRVLVSSASKVDLKPESSKALAELIDQLSRKPEQFSDRDSVFKTGGGSCTPSCRDDTTCCKGKCTKQCASSSAPLH